MKIIGLSVDSTGDHERWAADIAETQGTAPNYPLIADHDFQVAKLYEMLPADVSGEAKSRTPADNQTVRNVLVLSLTPGALHRLVKAAVMPSPAGGPTPCFNVLRLPVRAWVAGTRR